MTCLSSFFALLVAAGLQATPAGAVQWEKVWDAPGIVLVYVDRASITGPSALRSITTRTVYQGTLEKNVVERIRTEEYDCAAERARVRYVRTITNDGHAPTEITTGAERAMWQNPVQPNSLGEKKLVLACGEASLTPR